MNDFEERHNDDKEEWLQFGSNEAEKIRMLGCWVGAKEEVKNRKKELMVSGPSEKQPQRKPAFKETQSQDCRSMRGKWIFVRSWTISEIKSLQSIMDRCYRYIWSNKRTQPLREMNAMSPHKHARWT